MLAVYAPKVQKVQFTIWLQNVGGRYGIIIAHSIITARRLMNRRFLICRRRFW